MATSTSRKHVCAGGHGPTVSSARLTRNVDVLNAFCQKQAVKSVGDTCARLLSTRDVGSSDLKQLAVRFRRVANRGLTEITFGNLSGDDTIGQRFNTRSQVQRYAEKEAAFMD